MTGIMRATDRRPHQSKHVAMRSVFLLGCALAAGCTASAAEVAPPPNQLFFPTGMAVAPGDSLLFVANANSELRYDSGSVSVIDLAAVDSVIAGWTGASHTVPDGCSPDTDHRETLVCDEKQFILADAGARVGNFATAIGVQDLHNGQLRLIVPTRGDPSVTWMDWDGSRLTCNTGTGSNQLCDEEHRLLYVHNDPNLFLLPDEPFDVFVDSVADFAIITHLTSSAITLIDSPRDGKAMIADVLLGLFQPDPATGLFGTTGVSGRNPGPNDIVYVGSSQENRIQMLTVGTPANYDPINHPEHSKYIVPGNFFFDQFVGDGAGLSSDTRGMAFSQSGDRMYQINRNPPSLQIYDTSLGPTGFPQNTGIAATDLCREASQVTVLDPGDGERAYVTCFQDGQIYVVDPRGTGSVEDVIPVGRGPYAVVAAPSRGEIFVSNNLEDTVAVIDVSPTSPLRNRVVLRIGVPKPPGST